MVVNLELLVSAHLSVDSRMASCEHSALTQEPGFAGSRPTARNRCQGKGGAVAKGRDARWTEFIAGDSAPLNSLGQGVWEEVSYFGLTFPPAFLYQLEYMVGWGWGRMCLLFQIGLKGHSAEKFCFPL